MRLFLLRLSLLLLPYLMGFSKGLIKSAMKVTNDILFAKIVRGNFPVTNDIVSN